LKDYHVDPETLHQRWRAEAATICDVSTEISGVLGRRALVVQASDLDAVAEEMLSGRGLTAEHACFDRRDVMRGWCAGLPAGAAVDLTTLEELTEGFLEDGRVVPVVDGADRLADAQVVRRPDGSVTTALAVKHRWSTTDMVAMEQRL